jgi:hypothetical protein
MCVSRMTRSELWAEQVMHTAATIVLFKPFIISASADDICEACACIMLCSHLGVICLTSATYLHTYIHTHTHTHARARTYVDLNLGRFSWFAQNAQHLCILYSVAYFISENIDGFRWNLILVVAVTFVFLNRRQNVVAFFVRAEETAIYASLKWMEVGFEAIRINAFSKRIK